MTTAALDLSAHDRDARAVLDPDVWRDGAPVAALARLREHSPVHRVELPGKPPIWLVTRHADVLAVSRDTQVFASDRGNTFYDAPVPEGSAMLPSLDPPRHTHFRGLVSKGFTPRQVGRLEPLIRAVSREIADRVVAAGDVEVVETVSAELSLRVIAEVLGIPASDRADIFRWSNAVGSLGVEDPDYAPSVDVVMTAAAEMTDYCARLLARRRADPREDVVAALLAAEVDGRRLTTAQLTEFFVLLAVAGNETTRNAVSHGMLALSEHPDQQRRLSGTPAEIPAAVEEVLRWSSPVLHFRRTVRTDTELGGQRLRAGEWVVMHYLSANRDERVFDEPHRFDVTRPVPVGVVAFGGGGSHFCLGAQLARLELRVLLEELLPRVEIAVTGPPVRLRSAFFHGIKRLPATATAV